MPNITSFGNPMWPKVTSFFYTWAFCPNLRDISTFVFLENCNYSYTFYNTGIEYISINQVFRNGSLYNWTFSNCRSLKGFSDSGVHDDFIILGKSHEGCFSWSKAFALPMTYSVDLNMTFRESINISECFKYTNALTRYNGMRRMLRVDAPYAIAADMVFYSPDAIASERYFTILSLGLQRCNSANSFYGPLKVDEKIYIEYIPDSNFDPNIDIENFIYGMVADRNIILQIARNVDLCPYNRISPKLVNAINSYGNNAWRGIVFNNLTISLAVISDIQDSIIFILPGMQIEFVDCNFDDPDGLKVLQRPVKYKSVFFIERCTNVDILQNALTPFHTIIMR